MVLKARKGKGDEEGLSPYLTPLLLQEEKGFSLSHKELGLSGGNDNSPSKLRAASLTCGVCFG